MTVNKRLLAVFAHPDDEAFGPSGSLAKYAESGVEVHLLCATRGEAGVWQGKQEGKIENVREKELLKSAEILGIKKVEVLDFIDGTLSNSLYHLLADKIINKIQAFKPQVILTVERRGVSGHLDHIAVSMTTTYAYLKSQMIGKLYYHCLPKEWRDKKMDEYFIYMPEGYTQKEITTRIDISCCWEKKEQAMLCHKSQIQDVQDTLNRYRKWPKVDNFILQFHKGVETRFPETDLFESII